MRAYVLIETIVGAAALVVKEVRNLDLPRGTSLLSDDAVLGPFDVVLLVETTDLDTLVGAVTDRVHMIDGVQRTITCIA